MIAGFGDSATADLYNGRIDKGGHRLPSELRNVAVRKLDLIEVVTRLDELRVPPANRLEPLKGEREGTWSIRVNDRWRIVFRWIDGQAHGVSIVDDH